MVRRPGPRRRRRLVVGDSSLGAPLTACGRSRPSRPSRPREPATSTRSTARRPTCSAKATVRRRWSSWVARLHDGLLDHSAGRSRARRPDLRVGLPGRRQLHWSTDDDRRRAASSLDGTLRAAHVPRPVILVGHSIAGLTIRLYVGEHPADVSGVVLFDPTVASFARMFDDQELRPDWDGTPSADQVEQVTTWPDIPFEILRHDPAVYAAKHVWSAKVEARWGAAQATFATLAPHGRVTVVHGLRPQHLPRHPSSLRRGRSTPASRGGKQQGIVAISPLASDATPKRS